MNMQTELAEALDCFRTRSQQLWRWQPVIDYADEATGGFAMLEYAATKYGAAVVIPKVEQAISITFKVLMRADDSGGAIQLVIEDLLQLHLQLCLQEPPPPAKLVKWVLGFQLGEPGDYWHVDPVQYAAALGDRGIAQLREQLQRREQTLSTDFDGRPEPKFQHDDEWGIRHSLLYFRQRFAVLDRDETAILLSHLAETPRAHFSEDAAKALMEAEFFDRALAVAHEGMYADGGDHQKRACADLWVQLVARQQPELIRAATLEVFELWPTHARASALRRAVGEDWPEMREQVLERMRAEPRHLINFVIDEDPGRAWQEAHRAEEAQPARNLPGRTLYAIDVDTWEEVAERYAPIAPIDAIDKLAEMLHRRLEVADSSRYREVVARMQHMRGIGRRVACEEHAVAHIVELRSRYARRPALMKRMDAAGLPRG